MNNLMKYGYTIFVLNLIISYFLKPEFWRTFLITIIAALLVAIGMFQNDLAIIKMEELK